NQLLAVDNRHSQFMTMTILVIDPEHGTVRWASAGHDPTIVFHPDDGTFRELDGADLPLGIDAETQYEEYQSEIRSGDVLILGTDGIWETRNPEGELFGKERLRDLIRKARGGSAREIAEAIEKTVDEYRGHGTQQDDITFVA